MKINTTAYASDSPTVILGEIKLTPENEEDKEMLKNLGSPFHFVVKEDDSVVINVYNSQYEVDNSFLMALGISCR